MKVGVNIIGEFKRASPSLGPIRPDANATETVRVYEAAGVRALSVLTEPEFFHGTLQDLRRARAQTELPILRKDFTVSEYQINEAAAAGADAVLLIVAALSDHDLRRFRVRAEDELGLDALVEVHMSEEMDRAVACGAKLIGVNNRDLRTFKTSLGISERLASSAPDGVLLVSESGISSRADIERLTRCGYRGFLIGESLMRAEDPASLIRSLRGEPQIKVCGITKAKDARLCGELGVQMVGLNFSPESRRYILREAAHAIIDEVRPEFPDLRFTGIFVNQEIAFVQQTSDELRLDAVQLHGDESPHDVSRLQSPFVIKALRVRKGFSPDAATSYACDAILLDACNSRGHGGTGERIDWTVAAEVRRRVPRLVLAGGLTPENVAEAVAAVQPFAVDVCSGVEEMPGRKNHDKLRRFVRATR